MPDVLNNEGIVIPCPAKINLTLAVGAPRADGLHPIASVMVPVPFQDLLSIRTLDKGPSRFDRQVAPGCPKPIKISWPVESDLAYRAHALLEKQIGRQLPIQCVVSKSIPDGAGLGGGSADAAGMLVGLRALFKLSLSDARLAEIGAVLGADVPFAIQAVISRRAALVTGIGDVLEILPNVSLNHVVLVFPDGTCPTGQVYGAFDWGAGQARTAEELFAFSESWRSGGIAPLPMNDLTQAAIRVCPAIESAISSLKCLNLEPHMTGSGSALFVLARDRAGAQSIARQSQDAGLLAYAACSPEMAK